MLSVHILSLLFAFATIFVADKDALAWMRGKKTTLNARRVRILHWCTWLALLGLTGSGIVMLYPTAGYLLSQPLFVMKMLFVVVLYINAILIGRFSHIAVERPFASLTADERIKLILSGAISSVSWLGAAILALAFFR